MSLPNLPFPVPVAELGWDKFDQVPEAANLDRDECITVMKLVCGTVCGDPPPGFDTRSWWQTAPTNVETLVLAVENLKDTLGILGVYIYIIYNYMNVFPLVFTLDWNYKFERVLYFFYWGFVWFPCRWILGILLVWYLCRWILVVCVCVCICT